jgi:hypothetical protein
MPAEGCMEGRGVRRKSSCLARGQAERGQCINTMRSYSTFTRVSRPLSQTRPASLPVAPIDEHPDLGQHRSVSLHKAQFILVFDIRFAQQQLRMPLRRDRASQVEQQHELARRNFDRPFSHYRRQFGRDSIKYVGRREDAEMCDAQRAIRMIYI